MVPGSFGCGVAVLAAMAILAPSRAARSAIASPMPREAPEMKTVLPAKLVMLAPVSAAAYALASSAQAGCATMRDAVRGEGRKHEHTPTGTDRDGLRPAGHHAGAAGQEERAHDTDVPGAGAGSGAGQRRSVHTRGAAGCRRRRFLRRQ